MNRDLLKRIDRITTWLLSAIACGGMAFLVGMVIYLALQLWWPPFG